MKSRNAGTERFTASSFPTTYRMNDEISKSVVIFV